MDAAEGEHAIHAARTLYLPKLAEEETVDYEARLNRTPFFNAFWRTISGLKGTLFRKSPSLTAPDSVILALEDADMAGTPLDVLAQGLAEEVMITGRAGLLVDYPMVEMAEGMTVAEFESSGFRPCIAMYTADSIINWRAGRVGNRTALTFVVLAETATILGDSEFEAGTEARYRVLDLTDQGYRVRVFRVGEKSDELISETFPKMRGQAMWEIPFQLFGHDSLSWTVASPPLLDLAQLNLHHYQVSADYEHGCHFSGLPTPFISGMVLGEGERLRLGSKTAIVCPDPQAKGSYLETTSDFRALRTNLDEKKNEMAVLGARMLEGQKATVESAETMKQRASGEQSQLAAFADILSSGISRVLVWFRDWMRVSGDVSYQISKDFVPAGLTAQELSALVSAWQSGAISSETLHENLKAGELIDGTVSFEEEQERISSRGMVMSGAVDDPLPAAPVEPVAPAVDVAAIVDAIGRIPAPVVNYTPPAINIPATVVNIPEQQAPQITVNQPAITVNPAAVTVNNLDGGKSIELQYDAEGNVTGGTVKPEGL
jgi:hypothetical protein